MAPKRTRSSSSRVRTGCLTCKARRLKCDESKPICNKCQSSNRDCAGYLSAKAAATRAVSAKFTLYMPGIKRPSSGYLPHFDGDQERFAFEYFFLRTAHSFEAEFSTFLLSTVRNDPAINNALMALGAFHRALEYGSIRDSSFQSPGQIFAFQRYGHAIQSLLHIAQASKSTSFLAVSVLFAIFEGLVGNYKLVSLHLRSGIKLLREMLIGQAHQPSIKVVSKLLLPLDSLHMFRGPPHLHPYGPFPEIPPRFQSLEEARRSFYDYIALPSRFYLLKKILNPDRLLNDVQARLILKEETVRSLVLWEQWASSFGKIEGLRGHDYLNFSSEAFALRTCFVIAKIFLSSFDSPVAQHKTQQHSNEDGRFPEVYWLHELCLIQSGSEAPSTVSLQNKRIAATFPVGLLVGLFIGAFYCEEPVLDHIIDHLQSVGMWSSEIAMGVMQRMTNIRL